MPATQDDWTLTRKTTGNMHSLKECCFHLFYYFLISQSYLLYSKVDFYASIMFGDLICSVFPPFHIFTFSLSRQSWSFTQQFKYRLWCLCLPDTICLHLPVFVSSCSCAHLSPVSTGVSPLVSSAPDLPSAHGVSALDNSPTLPRCLGLFSCLLPPREPKFCCPASIFVCKMNYYFIYFLPCLQEKEKLKFYNKIQLKQQNITVLF